MPKSKLGRMRSNVLKTELRKSNDDHDAADNESKHSGSGDGEASTSYALSKPIRIRSTDMGKRELEAYYNDSGTTFQDGAYVL